MTVVYSEKLSEIIGAKIDSGLLRHVKKAALWYERVHTNSGVWKEDDHITRLLTLIDKKYGFSCSFTVAAVQRSQRRFEVFVFDHDEKVAIELVWEKCKRGKVARKVLVKMVVLRLEKTEGFLRSQPISLTRELLTIKGFIKAAGFIRSQTRISEDTIPWCLGEIAEVLYREDMDQSIFDEAWDLWKVKGIMAA
jgi:hypothetical protein